MGVWSVMMFPEKSFIFRGPRDEYSSPGKIEVISSPYKVRDIGDVLSTPRDGYES